MIGCIPERLNIRTLISYNIDFLFQYIGDLKTHLWTYLCIMSSILFCTMVTWCLITVVTLHICWCYFRCVPHYPDISHREYVITIVKYDVSFSINPSYSIKNVCNDGNYRKSLITLTVFVKNDYTTLDFDLYFILFFHSIYIPISVALGWRQIK